MEVTAEQLNERYIQLQTDELVDIYKNSELTKLAFSVLTGVLKTRGIDSEKLKTLIENKDTGELDAIDGLVPISLAKVWIGYLIIIIFFIFGLIGLAIFPESEDKILIVLTIISFTGYFYWLYCVQKLHQVISYASNATHSVSSTKAVVFHFIPLFNLYWVFKWPNEVANFVNKRSSEKQMQKGWVGIVLILGFLIAKLIPPVGQLMLFTVILYLNNKIKSVLEFS